MEATIEMDEIRKVAASLFEDAFPKNSLIEVVIKPRLDWEGDKILDVIFVFGKTKMLDPGEANKFSSFVRRRIIDMASDKDRFPMIEFVNKKDAKVMKIGTAA